MVLTRSQARAQQSHVRRPGDRRPYMIQMGPGNVRYVVEMRAHRLDHEGQKSEPVSLRWLGLGRALRDRRILCRFRAMRFAETADRERRVITGTRYVRKEVHVPVQKEEGSVCSYAVLGFSADAFKEFQAMWSFMTEANFHASYVSREFPREPDMTARSCVLCAKEKTSFGKCKQCGSSACRECLSEWVERKLTCPFCRYRNEDLPLRSDLEV